MSVVLTCPATPQLCLSSILLANIMVPNCGAPIVGNYSAVLVLVCRRGLPLRQGTGDNLKLASYTPRFDYGHFMCWHPVEETHIGLHLVRSDIFSGIRGAPSVGTWDSAYRKAYLRDLCIFRQNKCEPPRIFLAFEACFYGGAVLSNLAYTSLG